MVTGLTLNLFNFQEQAVIRLLEMAAEDSSGKQTIIVKSPTGSGKTVILIGFVDEYLKRVHKVVNHSAKQFVDGMASTNEIESVWACLKRSFYGIYHSFSTKHLQRYVNEITFRLNEGNVEFDTIDRINSLLLTSFSTHTTYREIIAA